MRRLPAPGILIFPVMAGIEKTIIVKNLLMPMSCGSCMVHFGGVDTIYQLYIDGELAGGVGRFSPEGNVLTNHPHRSYPVPNKMLADGELTLAVRIYRDGIQGPWFGGMFDGHFFFGDATAVMQREFWFVLPEIILIVISILVCTQSLLMFSGARHMTEYLWWGLFTLSIAVFNTLRSTFFGESYSVSMYSMELGFMLMGPPLLLETVWRMMNVKPHLVARLIQGVFLVAILIVFVFHIPTVQVSITGVWFLGAPLVFLLIGGYVYREAFKRNSGAYELIFGITAAIAGVAVDITSTRLGLDLPPVARYGFLILVLSVSLQMSQRFARLNTRLEDMVTERTELLEVKNVELTHAMNARSQFLANMSHELRTPLHGIMGLLQLLSGTKLDAQQNDYVRKADGSSQMLLTLINEVLDFSKIEAGKLEFESVPFAVKDIVEQVRSTIGVRANEKQVPLNTMLEDQLPTVVGDPLRLTQILVNLAGNAVKFTHYGHVEIKVECIDQTDDAAWLRFRVSDTGIGIEKERLKYLFEVFSQADTSTSRKFGGSGLGLAISQRLVRGMGGELDVESIPSVGSAFYFTLKLPRTTATPEQISVEDTSVPNLTGRRILIAEDAEVNQIVAREMLRETGATLTMANNGLEALECIATQTYDLVLMDIQMPELDGYSASRRMREAGVTTPIVAMTANVSIEDREQAQAAGMNDFVAKPFRSQELYNSLDLWINKGGIPGEDSQAAEQPRATYDLDEGLARVGGNESLFNELLAELITQSETAVTAFGQESAESRKLRAHRIKGIALNLGAVPLADASAAIEKAAATANLRDLLATFSRSLEELKLLVGKRK